MARPRSFDTEAFLDASLELFWRRGFAATSMSDVYEATGLGAGSIYSFVKDKNDLFRRVFERYGGGFAATLPKDKTGAEAINEWMGFLAGYLAEDPDRKGCMIANTIMERFAHSPETLAMAQARIEEVRGWFERQILAGQQEGRYRTDVDPAIAASALVATTPGMMAMARAHASRETLLQVGKNSTAALRARSGTVETLNSEGPAERALARPFRH